MIARGGGDTPSDRPLAAVPGVGAVLAERLARRGLHRVRDLWLLLPLRWEDRTRRTPLSSLVPGREALIEGTVSAVETGFRFRPQLRIVIGDESGATLSLRFFHLRGGFLAGLRPGERLRCFGSVRIGPHGFEMVHPEVRRLGKDESPPLPDRLTPIYPSVEGITQGRMRLLVERALSLLPEGEEDVLDPLLDRRLRLPPFAEALRFVHRPPPGTPVESLLEGRHPAVRRLAFEELLAQRVAMLLRRARIAARRAPPLGALEQARVRLAAVLPFALTATQERVIEEIGAELGSERPMLRLLQGDVGSGKTVVAAHALLQAVLSGHQGALLAPTEILAEQHAATLRRWFSPLGIEVVLLSGKLKGRARREALAALAGGAGVAVGTHALIQDPVVFRSLALVVVDEQHRFGVHQRLALREKGETGERMPHQLVMTATPIPRTLAMTRFADLDVSSLEGKPPGRQPVQTLLFPATRRAELIRKVGAYCARGGQAYWICTLIEESEQVEAQAAESVRDELVAALPQLAVGLVHGRMKSAQKQAVMDAFAAGRIALLVATTVVEVGVDVPGATLMVIENAERLGLAQLHQLRGRVGRGSASSYCVLVYQPPLSDLARARLHIMRETDDGFRIAEKDLELRGPGEFLGTRQTGITEFRIADLGRDRDLLPEVARLADELLAADPQRAERLAAFWLGEALRYGEA
ncbi:MAG: ATP-dependent DNA helicase RecG [Lysobacterales bacterium]|nr:MAG: ATP-dependent DNA helicase RecG [Xanthomonadales bacterium]